MVSRLVEREKMHEIDKQNDPNEETVRGKMKKFIRKRSAVCT
jgi:hypothetical protein